MPPLFVGNMDGILFLRDYCQLRILIHGSPLQMLHIAPWVDEMIATSEVSIDHRCTMVYVNRANSKRYQPVSRLDATCLNIL